MDIRIASDQSRQRVHRANATAPHGTRHAGIGAIPHISNSRTRRSKRQRRNYGEVVYVARPGGPVRSSGTVVGGCIGRRNRRAAASSHVQWCLG
ncbi:Hypothetical protein EPM1_2233 [Stenotrophomonas maltophilia EPM1]|nr:Hypothetical protein EPM1_2233 [Stenotrophomonas maltophilia EPM1]